MALSALMPDAGKDRLEQVHVSARRHAANERKLPAIRVLRRISRRWPKLWEQLAKQAEPCWGVSGIELRRQLTRSNELVACN